MKNAALSAFALVLLSATFSLCVVDLPELQMAYATPYTDIDVDTVHNMIANSSFGCCGFTPVIVLDVRTQSEYDSGHLYNVVLIPHTELEARIDELAGHENHEIIVYCRTGRRSIIASEILDSHNFTKVYNMLGGIQAWQSAGYPISNPVGTNRGAPFWMQWWFWTIVVAGIIALAGAVYFQKKRKPPTPITPTPPTEGIETTLHA